MSYIELSKDNFASEVIEEKACPVLVDFWATWCGPCRLIAPHVEAIAKEHTEITVGKVNVDDEGALAAAFDIVSIPTVLLFREGKVVGKVVFQSLRYYNLCQLK